MDKGKSLEDARLGAINGCVEITGQGNDHMASSGYVNLAKCLELALNNGVDPVSQQQIDTAGDQVQAIEIYPTAIAAKVRGIQVHKAYLVSCVNSRLEDLEAAGFEARVLAAQAPADPLFGTVPGQVANPERPEIMALIEMFRGRVVDIGNKSLMIEVSGPERKVEAFIESCRPYGIKNLARTGTIAMPRQGKAG